MGDADGKRSVATRVRTKVPPSLPLYGGQGYFGNPNRRLSHLPLDRKERDD